MTFACKHFDHDQQCCRRLNCDCIPGRPGCVLDGQVQLSDELKKRIVATQKPPRGKPEQG